MTNDIPGTEILGATVRGSIDEPLAIPVPPSCREINFVCTEVTGLCPVTGQPDYYTIEISVYPNPRQPFSLESKSLKLYLQKFRNEGIFCENLADEISSTVLRITGSNAVIVKAIQSPRGGISIHAISEKFREGDSE